MNWDLFHLKKNKIKLLAIYSPGFHVRFVICIILIFSISKALLHPLQGIAFSLNLFQLLALWRLVLAWVHSRVCFSDSLSTLQFWIVQTSTNESCGGREWGKSLVYIALNGASWECVLLLLKWGIRKLSDVEDFHWLRKRNYCD